MMIMGARVGWYVVGLLVGDDVVVGFVVGGTEGAELGAVDVVGAIVRGVEGP